MYATYLHGDAQMVDYTSSGAVNAGDVIVTNDTPRVAHLDIPANRLGALAARGGIYKMPKVTTGGSAIPTDKKVYWDATAHVITLTAGGNKGFGRTLSTSVDGDSAQVVLHEPF